MGFISNGRNLAFGLLLLMCGFGFLEIHGKLGELNERCTSKLDCRSFGYVCRDNRTCQCDLWYIPNKDRTSCVGGVDQRCIYDEHCIEGAFCLHQSLCQCKDSSPYVYNQGLVCSGVAGMSGAFLQKFAFVVMYFVVCRLAL